MSANASAFRMIIYFRAGKGFYLYVIRQQSHLSNEWYSIPIFRKYDELSYEQISQMKFDNLYKQIPQVCIEEHSYRFPCVE
jgi:hypothetical protein